MNRPDTVMLRLARPNEARALAVMSRDLVETGLAWRYTPQRMATLMAHADTLALVAEDEASHALHGFAVMQFGERDAHLALLCVQPAQRHRSIGRRLVEWLLASARVAGMAQVRLELRADNLAALALYQRLGFAQTSLLPGYYGGTVAARRMALQLRDALAG